MQRFMSVDPLADVPHSVGLSPYHFVANNPINNIDPDGRDWYTNNETGKTHWQEGSGDLDGHKNIGANYTIIGENQTIVHEQNEVVSVTDNILPEATNNTSFSESRDFVNRSMTNADAATTFVGGIGLNYQEVNRAGNHGSRFRAKLFGTNLKLRGSFGSKIATGIKVGGPLLSVGSIGLSLTSNQSAGFKIADTGSSLAGIFGGAYGALGSIGYSFGVKPMIRSVVSPTKAESRSLHQFQYRNSRSNYCRGLRCQ